MTRDTIEIENVNHPGKTYRVDGEKYRMAREAYLGVLPSAPPGLTQAESSAAMREALKDNAALADKAGWWMKSVQLDLEAKGIVVRDAGKPLRWRKI